MIVGFPQPGSRTEDRPMRLVRRRPKPPTVASTIERLMDKPMPMPSVLVV